MTSLLYDNIRPEYYLRKWRFYEAAREELDSVELENAKVFFHGLKQLSQSELELLFDIYYIAEQCTIDRRTGYYSSVKPVKASVLAVKYCISADQFKAMQHQAQMNLKQAMQEIMNEICSSYTYRINKHLYLVGITNQGTSKEQYVLGNELDAKKFNVSDGEHEINTLMSLGFERVPQSKKFKQVSK